MQGVRAVSCSLFLVICLFIFHHFAAVVQAKVGVGISTGKIMVDEQLKAGQIYNLPSVTIFNTGDVPSTYDLSVAYHELQSELQPAANWFVFDPSFFSLDPGQGKEVKIQLHLPLQVQPGFYFAYLEGSPVSQSSAGETRVGIAAASKIYFEVVPANFFESVYYRLRSLHDLYHPWPQRAMYGLLLLLLLYVFRKFFRIEINLKK